MFKLLNNIVYIPNDCKPVNGTTRASNSMELIRSCARADIYLHSFFVQTISDCNNLRLSNIDSVIVEEFKEF